MGSGQVSTPAPGRPSRSDRAAAALLARFLPEGYSVVAPTPPMRDSEGPIRPGAGGSTRSQRVVRPAARCVGRGSPPTRFPGVDADAGQCALSTSSPQALVQRSTLLVGGDGLTLRNTGSSTLAQVPRCDQTVRSAITVGAALRQPARAELISALPGTCNLAC